MLENGCNLKIEFLPSSRYSSSEIEYYCTNYGCLLAKLCIPYQAPTIGSCAKVILISQSNSDLRSAASLSRRLVT